MDLSGIVVFLYYEPVDYSDSDVFEIIADFYVSILTSHNATVYINEPFKTNWNEILLSEQTEQGDIFPTFRALVFLSTHEIHCYSDEWN